MTTATVVSLAGALISALGALTALALNRRAVIMDRRLAADELADRYRVPLLHAAFNLQSRLYNIASNDFLAKYLVGGSQQEAEYARFNTVYLISQYLCWAEILRREVLLLEPLHRGRDRDIVMAMESVRHDMAQGARHPDSALRVFRGDQRAIGEVMLTIADDPGGRYSPRWECIGYAAFVLALADRKADMIRWIQPLLDGIDAIAASFGDYEAKVVAIQHHLVELVDLIDPHGNRIPVSLRERL